MGHRLTASVLAALGSGTGSGACTTRGVLMASAHDGECTQFDRQLSEPDPVSVSACVLMSLCAVLCCAVSPRDEPRKLLAVLTAADHPLAQHADSAAALQELGLLFDYLEVSQGGSTVQCTGSLVRAADSGGI